MQEPLEKRCIGKSSVEVSRLGLGGVGLGDPGTDRTLTEHQSDAIVEAAWESGIAYFDTSPWYGCGRSEHRIGHVLHGKLRKDKGRSGGAHDVAPVPEPGTLALLALGFGSLVAAARVRRGGPC